MAQYKLDLPIVKLQMKETKAGRQRSVQRWQSCTDVQIFRFVLQGVCWEGEEGGGRDRGRAKPPAERCLPLFPQSLPTCTAPSPSPQMFLALWVPNTSSTPALRAWTSGSWWQLLCALCRFPAPSPASSIRN